jgi:uncharacterized membrane protein
MADTGTTRDEPGGSGLRRGLRLVRLPLSGSGSFLGLAFFAASLTPSLVPRGALMQGILGGACFAAGYGIAVVLRATWLWLGLRLPGGRVGVSVGIAGVVFGLVLAVFALAHAADWQNSIRSAMSLAPVETTRPLRVAAVAALTAAVLLCAAWLLASAAAFVTRRAGRLVPPRMAAAAGLLVAAGLAVAVYNGVLVRQVMRGVDSFYTSLDAYIPAGSAPPEDPSISGSRASLVDWGELGRAGRDFVTRAPDVEAIADFWGERATQPVRVYVGLAAADDAQARAELALRELIRVGGFERSVLVVATPTGTGFMEQAAIAPLEYLHLGDVATVGMQYSYLQSPFSLVFEPGYGAASARALMRVVYAYWAALPEGRRPRIYLQGLSLGALSSERSMRLHEVLADPIHGALWSGPPFPSPIHADVTRFREPGSPSWMPRFGDGSFIRFTGRESVLAIPGAEWGPVRIVYLQHPSDPIVVFSPSLLWTRPSWLESPRAPDVSAGMRWYPVVTALQVAADMAVATSTPPGYGHQYAAASYIDGWVEITDPAVTPAQVARLKALFGN